MPEVYEAKPCAACGESAELDDDGICFDCRFQHDRDCKFARHLGDQRPEPLPTEKNEPRA